MEIDVNKFFFMAGFLAYQKRQAEMTSRITSNQRGIDVESEISTEEFEALLQELKEHGVETPNLIVVIPS